MLVENTLPHNLFRSANEAIQLIAALAKGKFNAEKIVDTLFCGAISSPAPKKVKLERLIRIPKSHRLETPLLRNKEGQMPFFF